MLGVLVVTITGDYYFCMVVEGRAWMLNVQDGPQKELLCLKYQ